MYLVLETRKEKNEACSFVCSGPESVKEQCRPGGRCGRQSAHFVCAFFPFKMPWTANQKGGGLTPNPATVCSSPPIFEGMWHPRDLLPFAAKGRQDAKLWHDTHPPS